MNKFASALENESNKTYTENGAAAFRSSKSACVDFFFKAGTTRNMSETQIMKLYNDAAKEDEAFANAILLYTRDCRGGMGERRLFRVVLKNLDKKKSKRDLVRKLLNATPELGRYDDLFEVNSDESFAHAINIFKDALDNEDKQFLAAKWAPRKSPKGRKGLVTRIVKELYPEASLSVARPQYRQIVAELSKGSLERKLTEGRMDEVNLSQVSAVALARNRSAIEGQAKEKFEDFIDAVEEGTAEIKAGVVFPHDVVREISFSWHGIHKPNPTQRRAIVAQWNALPNYMGDRNVLPLIDTSGSMMAPVDKSGLSAMAVALSIGLYCSEKTSGAFNNAYLTFQSHPSLVFEKGDIVDKIERVSKAPWGGSTNIEAAFDRILSFAKQNNVPQSDMPETLLIISDMQFDQATHHRQTNYHHRQTNYQRMRDQYAAAGYTAPQVVFWNVAGGYGRAETTPVVVGDDGTALVSGFSPAIAQTIMGMEGLSPAGVVMAAVNKPRYNVESYV